MSAGSFGHALTIRARRFRTPRAGPAGRNGRTTVRYPTHRRLIGEEHASPRVPDRPNQQVVDPANAAPGRQERGVEGRPVLGRERVEPAVGDHVMSAVAGDVEVAADHRHPGQYPVQGGQLGPLQPPVPVAGRPVAVPIGGQVGVDHDQRSKPDAQDALQPAIDRHRQPEGRPARIGPAARERRIRHAGDGEPGERGQPSGRLTGHPSPPGQVRVRGQGRPAARPAGAATRPPGN